MPIAALALLDQTGARTVNRDLLADLRRQVAGLERAGQVMKDAVALGVPEIDCHLSNGGLAGGAVHEMLGGAVTGFAASIAARLDGPVLWCLDASRRENPYGPGLKALGFNPERLILARCRGLKEMLWTMEEGLRSTAPSLVIAELEANIGLIIGNYDGDEKAWDDASLTLELPIKEGKDARAEEMGIGTKAQL